MSGLLYSQLRLAKISAAIAAAVGADRYKYWAAHFIRLFIRCKPDDIQQEDAKKKKLNQEGKIQS